MNPNLIISEVRQPESLQAEAIADAILADHRQEAHPILLHALIIATHKLALANPCCLSAVARKAALLAVALKTVERTARPPGAHTH